MKFLGWFVLGVLFGTSAMVVWTMYEWVTRTDEASL